jgi:type IV pilus assembly protein PilV
MNNTVTHEPARLSAVGRGQVTRGPGGLQGFTLLEVLVSMLVLAIGLLGVAAMQLRGLQYNHDAYLRSQISVLAYDVADRIRLNQSQAASYVGDYTVPTSAPSGCTQAAVSASNDLARSHRQVYEALPPGSRANITVASNEYTISLEWDDREGESRAIAYTFIP